MSHTFKQEIKDLLELAKFCKEDKDRLIKGRLHLEGSVLNDLDIIEINKKLKVLQSKVLELCKV